LNDHLQGEWLDFLFDAMPWELIQMDLLERESRSNHESIQESGQCRNRHIDEYAYSENARNGVSSVIVQNHIVEPKIPDKEKTVSTLHILIHDRSFMNGGHMYSKYLISFIDL